LVSYDPACVSWSAGQYNREADLLPKLSATLPNAIRGLI